MRQPPPPLAIQHLGPADYRVMPWKDGGGSTTQMAIDPPGATLSDPFLWRLSSARVERAGPFSTFPGMARLLALLSGQGLLLDVAGGPRLRLKHPEKPVAFAGDATVHATIIQGPVVDLGLIYDPARIQADLQVLRLGPDARSQPLGGTTLVVAPEGGVHVDPLGVALGPLDLLRLEEAAGGRLGLRGEGSGTPALVITLKRN